MIKIYTSSNCNSCKKVKKWFEKYDIQYIEKNISTNILEINELKEILFKTINGTEDIISFRSKIIKNNKIDIENMSTFQLMQFIKENPSILRRPIIVNEHQVQVGYNEEEIRSFIPKK